MWLPIGPGTIPPPLSIAPYVQADNILFSQAGTVKLVDFGLVKLLEDDMHLTQTGMLCGTPLYMSPEQASNQEMDARSDLYSLGATYFALLTGRPPFLGNGVPQILMSHVSAPTPDPRDFVPDIPEPCVRVVMRAMAKKREERYQSAAEMGADLEAILTGVPLRSASVFTMEESARKGKHGMPTASGSFVVNPGSSGMSAVHRSVAPGSGFQISPSAKASSPTRRMFLTAGGLGILGLAAFAGFRLYPNRSKDTPATGPLPVVATSQPPIKVGILHSLTGALAVSERPLVDAALLAIEELNGRGGLLGRPVEAVVIDGKSEVTADSAFTRAAEKLLTKDKVAVVFGGFGSGGRKSIRPYFEKYDQLLFYPAQYEGLEESQNVVYTGATPNQLVIPSIKWAVEHLDAKRFYLVGTDGLRARAMNAIIEDTVKELGGEVVGSHYALVGESTFAPIVKKIKHAKPQIIINDLVGDSIVSFFRALVDADITPDEIPVLSYTLGENELVQLGSMSLAGQYIARTRFPVVPGEKPDAPDGSDAFAQRFKKKYGEHRPVSEIMESAYYGVLLWAEAVKLAGTEEVSRVRSVLKEREYEIHGVRLHLDPSNQHVWKVFQVGQIAKQNAIQVIKTGDAPIPPIPFPAPRTRAEWQNFADALYTKWGNNWANPLKPQLKKKK